MAQYKIGALNQAVVFSGYAVVCCVHDREKRVVNNEADVAALAEAAGTRYIKEWHGQHLHKCVCCENMFHDRSDEPMFCYVCRGPLVHPLGGPLPEPKGAIQ